MDVYAAANTKLPDQLYEDGLLEQAGQVRDQHVRAGCPKDSDIKSMDDLTAAGVKIAIGSEVVPIGSYTREVLAQAPARQEKAILANVRSNEPDVKGIVGKLTQGAVDAGFVYVTDVNADERRAQGDRPARRAGAEVTYAAGVVERRSSPTRRQASWTGYATAPAPTRSRRRASARRLDAARSGSRRCWRWRSLRRSPS